MKYPYIIFYRLEKFSHIDKFFIANNEKLNCSIFFTNQKEDLNKLFDIYKGDPEFIKRLTSSIDRIIKLEQLGI